MDPFVTSIFPETTTQGGTELRARAARSLSGQSGWTTLHLFAGSREDWVSLSSPTQQTQRMQSTQWTDRRCRAERWAPFSFSWRYWEAYLPLAVWALLVIPVVLVPQAARSVPCRSQSSSHCKGESGQMSIGDVVVVVVVVVAPTEVSLQLLSVPHIEPRACGFTLHAAAGMAFDG